MIYTSGKLKENVEKLLPKDFKSLADWLEKNDLVINLKNGKTECMLFETVQRVIQGQLTPPYFVIYKHLQIP